MSVPARIRVIVLALIAFSAYIGVEIDYRHWTWVLFLIVIPVVLAAGLLVFVTRPRKHPEQQPSRNGQSERS